MHHLATIHKRDQPTMNQKKQPTMTRDGVSQYLTTAKEMHTKSYFGASEHEMPFDGINATQKQSLDNKKRQKEM